MIRVALALGILVFGTVDAAPVPKDFKKTLPDYFPLHPGNEWVYDMNGTEVRVVTKDVIEKNGVKTGRLVTLTGEREVAEETIRVDHLGVHRTHINKIAVDPPLTMVSFDPKQENKWKVKSTVELTEISGTYEVAGVDEMELPTGKVQAVNVVAEIKIGATPTVVKYWFASGVGQVKISYTMAGMTHMMKLKEYKPGKK